MTLWVVSDTHFSHTNIWQLFKADDGSPARPFHSNEEMNERMVEEWNRRVRPTDHVYHLGDVTMARGHQTRDIDIIMGRLNGHKRIVLGNHDQLARDWYPRWFEKIKASNVLDGLLFTHIPVHPESLGRFKVNVHGHTHLRSVLTSPHHPDPRYINVCVEQTNYAPVSLEELKQRVVQ